MAEGARAVSDRLHRLAIEKVLVAELDCARRRQQLAGQRLRDLTGQVPSGIPAPDSNLQLREAGAAYLDAMATYQAALGRFTDFVARGIIPADLSDARF